jgi:hypothetical protein
MGWEKVTIITAAAAAAAVVVVVVVVVIIIIKFNIEDSVVCTMNSKHEIAATLYTLETWFAQRR